MFLQKGVCIRYTCCDENLIVLMFKGVEEAKDRSFDLFFDSVLISLSLKAIGDVVCCWSPILCRFPASNIRFHSSLKE